MKFSPVTVDIAAGASQTLATATAGRVQRLARLWGTLTTAGWIQFLDSDGSPLSAEITFGANALITIDPTREIDQMLAAPVGKGLVMRSSAPFRGWARMCEDF